MNLQPDGSWKPISWPLPMGEVRDVPETARVHGSVIRRLRQDESYRPGNLIIGGSGRSVRRAPKEHGIGEWECVQEKASASQSSLRLFVSSPLLEIRNDHR